MLYSDFRHSIGPSVRTVLKLFNLLPRGSSIGAAAAAAGVQRNPAAQRRRSSLRAEAVLELAGGFLVMRAERTLEEIVFHYDRLIQVSKLEEARSVNEEIQVH